MGSPWLVAVPPAQAETTTAAAGICLVVEVTLSGSWGVPPNGALNVRVDATGPCEVNNASGSTITISGTLQAPAATWTCAGGVATGQLTFSVTHTKFVSNVVAQVALTVGGGAAGMVAVEDTANPVFTGTGAYVGDATSCATSPTGPMTFCGAFTFVRGNPAPPVRS